MGLGRRSSLYFIIFFLFLTSVLLFTFLTLVLLRIPTENTKEGEMNISHGSNFDVNRELLISYFGIDDYMCTGSCSCLSDKVDRRTAFSTSSRLFTRAVSLIVSSVSVSVALGVSKRKFEEKCVNELSSECSTSAILSEVDDCVTWTEEEWDKLSPSERQEKWEALSPSERQRMMDMVREYHVNAKGSKEYIKELWKQLGKVDNVNEPSYLCEGNCFPLDTKDISRIYEKGFGVYNFEFEIGIENLKPAAKSAWHDRIQEENCEEHHTWKVIRAKDVSESWDKVSKTNPREDPVDDEKVANGIPTGKSVSAYYVRQQFIQHVLIGFCSGKKSKEIGLALCQAWIEFEINPENPSVACYFIDHLRSMKDMHKDETVNSEDESTWKDKVDKMVF